MTVPSARRVTQAELAAWRQRLPRGWQRAVSQPRRRRMGSSPAVRVGDDAAAFDVESTPRVGPAEAYEQVASHLGRTMLKSREDFQMAVRQMRKFTPGMISHLTDEQAAEMLEREYNRRVQEAVQRVYHRTGRSDELAIRIS